MTEKLQPTFCYIMNENMLDVKSNRHLVEALQDKGINCSIRTIQRYKLGTVVPSYEMAMAILKCLKISIKSDDLIKILNQSKEHRDELNSSAYKKESFSVDLDLIEFPAFINDVYKRQIIRERIKSLYGENGTLSQYVSKLIEEDIKNIK